MTELDTLIKTVAEGLKSMAQGVEKLAEKVEGIGKSLSKEKAKARRKAPAKPEKKAAVKAVKPAAKKPLTAADTVLGVIKRSKKGVDTATLMKKTGYDRKKVANIVFKLRKQEKIKSEKKGVYLKV